MKLTQVKGNTYVLEGAGLIGLYRLPGERCILLDSGERYERQELADALAQAALTPVGVLTSHIHTDHSINNRWLRETYGCAVAVPAGELYLLRSPLALRNYLYCWSPGALEREYGDMLCPVDAPIPEEDGVFSFCGADFHTLHTPGHSPDHTAFLTPDNVCYAADAVLGLDNRAKLPYAFGLAAMADSAGRLAQPDCAAYILTHREVCRDIQPRIRHTRALLRQRGAEIAALIDRPMTAGEVFERVNLAFGLRTARPLRAQQMERNLRHFLDLLVDQGTLALTAHMGQFYYAPAQTGEEAAK